MGRIKFDGTHKSLLGNITVMGRINCDETYKKMRRIKINGVNKVQLCLVGVRCLYSTKRMSKLGSSLAITFSPFRNIQKPIFAFQIFVPKSAYFTFCQILFFSAHLKYFCPKFCHFNFFERKFFEKFYKTKKIIFIVKFSDQKWF